MPMQSKRVLIIAFHFPPASGSSGLQRSLKFARYLGEYGWQPAVLTVTPWAHLETSDQQLAEIPADIVVRRALALDAARHLSLRGAYPQFLALPDRWCSWWWSGVPIGLAMIRKLGVSAIFSTYPIATAHRIGATLKRMTGLPWIADCRDSMTEEHYPTNPAVRRRYVAIERRMVASASKVLFTTPGTLRLYAGRYPEIPADRWYCLPNGYDEENFMAAALRPPVARPPGKRKLLVHSGIVYPKERDPTALFAALAQLRDRKVLTADGLCVRLRATANDAEIRALIERFGIGEFVELAPPLPYHDALAEMLGADGLLVLQGASCNHQIPAKIYEYLRAGRPVLALTDPRGDTGELLAKNGVEAIAMLEDREAVGSTLMKFLQSLPASSAVTQATGQAEVYSRRAQTGELARLLDAVTSDRR